MAFPAGIDTFKQKLLHIGQLSNAADGQLFSAARGQKQSRKRYLQYARQQFAEAAARCADLIGKLE